MTFNLSIDMVTISLTAPRHRAFMQTLDQLPHGQLASIVEIVGDDAAAARLMEMGLHMGEAVEVIGRAPLRDPITVLCRGSRLALRSADARRICVRQLDGDQIPS